MEAQNDMFRTGHMYACLQTGSNTRRHDSFTHLSGLPLDELPQAGDGRTPHNEGLRLEKLDQLGDEGGEVHLTLGKEVQLLLAGYALGPHLAMDGCL